MCKFFPILKVLIVSDYPPSIINCLVHNQIILGDCELGQWSHWKWSEANQRCGNGTRTRTIKKDAEHGGRNCTIIFGQHYATNTTYQECENEGKTMW